MKLRLATGATALGLALTLSACMTASRDLSFTPSSQTAMVINVSPARTDVARWAIFTRIYPETGAIGEDYSLEIGWGSSSQLSNESGRLLALSARELPPGDYAITELGINDVDGPGYNQRGTSWLCTNRAAPVYSLTSGVIVLVRTDVMYPDDLGDRQSAPPSDAAVMVEFERVRESYPSIEGIASIAEPHYWITFTDAPSTRWAYRCHAPQSFTLRPSPRPGEPNNR